MCPLPLSRLLRWGLGALLLLLPRLAAAQTGDSLTIQGRVLDAETGAPVPNSHVFISHSTSGTTTDSLGRFRLRNLQSGSLRLYLSHVGYAPKQYDLLLSPDTTVQALFRLEPTVLEQDSVVVEAERDEEWYERLERFKRHFVGPSEWADSCEIVNPEVLRFDTAWWGKFEADADRPLVLINRALGYRVTYYLGEFEVQGNIIRWDGDPVFEPLPPKDSTEARRWVENRRTAFYGSLRHFMLALLHDRVEAEGFRIYRQPRAHAVHRRGRADRIPTSRDRILELRANNPHELNVRGRLEVHYDKAGEKEAYLDWADARRTPRDYQLSVLEFNERPIHLDAYGEIVEPYGVTLHNYFAFSRRLATLLPKNYRPVSHTTLPPLTTDALP